MLKYEIIKRMKTLRESLLDDELVKKADEIIIKDEIESFLKENYDYINYMGAIKISNKPNKDGKYEVSSTKNIRVKNYNITSLTNGMFIWSIVSGYFDCNYCRSLKSLEGAPKKVGDNFYCSRCNSLKSLEGAPKEVGGNFYCYNCASKFTIEDVKKISNVKGAIMC